MTVHVNEEDGDVNIESPSSLQVSIIIEILNQYTIGIIFFIKYISHFVVVVGHLSSAF